MTKDSRAIEVSNPDKVFHPGEGITEGEVVDCYRRVAEVMLPHLEDRPLSMHRFPDGLGGESFFQKEAPDYFWDWVRGVTVPKEGGRVTHLVCDEARTLVNLTDQACLTPHVWLSVWLSLVDHRGSLPTVTKDDAPAAESSFAPPR
ncbi:MAG: hypothetical protein ACRDXD_02440 [Acidimicrobiia bacterium]